MKKKLSTMFMSLCMLVVSSFAVGCGNVEVTLSTENDVTTLKPGESTQIIMDVTDNDKIKLEISEGEEYATLTTEGVLTIKEDAKVGEVVTTVATLDGEVVSNELDITIASILAQSITASVTPNSTTIDRGGIVVLSYTTTPAKITENVTWTITEGASHASIIAGSILTVSNSAPYDTVIKVKAKSDSNVYSNELTFTVASVPLTGLTISSIPNKTDVEKGDEISLNYTATPTNTTETITFSITAGSEYATLEGNVLTIKNTAPIGSTITVKGQGTSISSNTLTFTVVASSEETRSISAPKNMTIDSASSSANTLEIEVLNGSFQQVTGEEVTYTITEGEEFLAIDHENGYTCDLQVLGHGTATLKVSVDGAQDQTVTINCIKAPDSILVPEALIEKTGIEFATGVNQDIEGFSFTTTGTNVCTALNYTFEKWNGTAYETTTKGTLTDNKLKFTETGKYKVTAISNSGSSRYVSKEVVFVVNEGVNVNTYEDFKTNLEAGNIVNIMNLTNKNGAYNYNLVPSAILNNSQTSTSYTDAIIAIKGKNVKINGNGFRLDLSKLAYVEENNFDYGALINIDCTDEQTTAYQYNEKTDQTQQDIDARKRKDLNQADYFVEINNLDIIGNANVDGRISDHEFVMNTEQETSTSVVVNAGASTKEKLEQRLRSSFYRGIHIGDDNTFVAYQVTMNNINVGGFTTGLRLCHAVNSSISNAFIGNCFSNGIETVASKITLTNMTYGACGVTGIEITPDMPDCAGLTFAENQTITFAGDITMYNSSLNNGATPSMQVFEYRNGASVMQILAGSMIYELGGNPYDPNPSAQDMQKMSNVSQSLTEPSFGLIALIFEEDNPSTLQYSNELDDGIVNFAGLSGANDAHQYIELPLVEHLGRALLFNVNYIED